jgi:hypothetical protein
MSLWRRGLRNSTESSWVASLLRVVHNTSEYETLLALLQTDLKLATAEPDVLDSIRDAITDAMPASRFVDNLHRSPEIFETVMNIKCPWNIAKEVESRGIKPADIGNIIAVTGTLQHAQVTTIAQYMSQVWPRTAEWTLAFIQEAVKSGPRGIKFGESLSAKTLVSSCKTPVINSGGDLISQVLRPMEYQLTISVGALSLLWHSPGPLHASPSFQSN